MQVNSELNNEIIIDKANIKEFVNDLNYPLYFMDFETFSTAVPIFDKSRPISNWCFNTHYMFYQKTMVN
jgi:hypothetical protein